MAMVEEGVVVWPLARVYRFHVYTFKIPLGATVVVTTMRHDSEPWSEERPSVVWPIGQGVDRDIERGNRG